jgi:two-component system, NtrC family, response regulator AtoC
MSTLLALNPARELLVDHAGGPGDETTCRQLTSTTQTVLVVDDESLIRWSLNDCLSRAGYDVLEAESGWSAAAHLGAQGMKRDVDLVLLDYVLPGGGFQFIEWLREAYPQTHVIMMSSAVTADLVDNARARNVRTVIDKPFDAENVTRLVRSELAS